MCEQPFHDVGDRHPELAVADLPVLVPVHRLNHVLDLARCQLVNQDYIIIVHTCEEIHPRRLRDFPSRAVPKKGKKGLELGPETVLASHPWQLMRGLISQ